MLATTNGQGQRKLESWIDQFIRYTDSVETPSLFRKWSAIATIAAVLEQKVWLKTSSEMYPNLYTGMIGTPGAGKTRIISEVSKVLQALPEPFIAPTSVNSASLVDNLVECRRILPQHPGPAIEYNSMVLLADELGAFMHEYEMGLIAELTSFYDVTALPYGQRRRGGNLKIKIDRPQLNILFGSTPSNLAKFMPEAAWSQGFASRIIFVYANEKVIVDDFNIPLRKAPKDLIHDLNIINGLVGQFQATPDYGAAIKAWRDSGEQPRPTHPRLLHYCARRKAHLYRLSMVSSVDRSNSLVLTKADLDKAMEWLFEAEATMSHIFDQGDSPQGAVMDEAYHYIQQNGSVEERNLVAFLRHKLPTNAILETMRIMEQSGMIVSRKNGRFGKAFTVAAPIDTSPDELPGLPPPVQ